MLLVAANKASVIDEPVSMEYWWNSVDRRIHFAYSKWNEDLAGNEYGCQWWEMLPIVWGIAQPQVNICSCISEFSRNWEKRLTFLMSCHVCLCLPQSARNNSASTGRILIKFGMREFFWNYVEKIQVSLK